MRRWKRDFENNRHLVSLEDERSSGWLADSLIIDNIHCVHEILKANDRFSLNKIVEYEWSNIRTIIHSKGVFTKVLTRSMLAFLLAPFVYTAKCCCVFTLCFTCHILEISNCTERMREYK